MLKREVLCATLLLLALCGAVSAQTSGSQKRSRNHRPQVTLSLSAPYAKLICPGTTSSQSGQDKVEVLIKAVDPDKDNLEYRFTVTGGEVYAWGTQIIWDLKKAKEGRHKVTVRVNDGRGGLTLASAYVEAHCDMLYMCPQLHVISSANEVLAGEPLTFTLKILSGDARVTPVYRWKLSAGKITSGQGTPVITVKTDGVGDKGITATVEVGGYDPGCDRQEAVTVKTRRKN